MKFLSPSYSEFNAYLFDCQLWFGCSHRISVFGVLLGFFRALRLRRVRTDRSCQYKSHKEHVLIWSILYLTVLSVQIFFYLSGHLDYNCTGKPEKIRLSRELPGDSKLPGLQKPYLTPLCPSFSCKLWAPWGKAFLPKDEQSYKNYVPNLFPTLCRTAASISELQVHWIEPHCLWSVTH